jgi:hypothetical protein
MLTTLPLPSFTTLSACPAVGDNRSGRGPVLIGEGVDLVTDPALNDTN